AVGPTAKLLRMPSRNVVFGYRNGGATMSSATRPAIVHVAPPSFERSMMILSDANWCAGPPLVRVVQSVPSGATCGNRYVAPCGIAEPTGSLTGVDQSVCLPSGSAVAHETTGCGVQQPVQSTHIASTRS